MIRNAGDAPRMTTNTGGGEAFAREGASTREAPRRDPHPAQPLSPVRAAPAVSPRQQSPLPVAPAPGATPTGRGATLALPSPPFAHTRTHGAAPAAAQPPHNSARPSAQAHRHVPPLLRGPRECLHPNGGMLPADALGREQGERPPAAAAGGGVHPAGPLGAHIPPLCAAQRSPEALSSLVVPSWALVRQSIPPLLMSPHTVPPQPSASSTVTSSSATFSSLRTA